MVAHDLLNKFSAIVGYCDLLGKITEPGTECARRLALIHDTAESAANELKEHQLKAEADMRKTG